jgi:hypothetical protein
MEEYLLKKRISKPLITFISKNITTQEQFNIIDFLIDNNITQYLIQDFIKKKLHMEQNGILIAQYLLHFKKNTEYAKLFLFGCVKLKNPIVVYELLEICYFYKVNDTKSLLKNLSVKVKNTNSIEHLMVIVKSKINELTEVNFITMTKLLHTSVDQLQPKINESFESMVIS